MCGLCHITACWYWQYATRLSLEVSVRHAADPAYSAFLNTIRLRAPTQAEIDAIFGKSHADDPTYVTQDQVAALCDADTTVLCTHREDALAHNLAILQRLEGTGVQEVVPCPLHHNVLDPDAAQVLDGWLREPAFHSLPCVAVGARVCLTDNVALPRGAANGATGTVVALRQDAGGYVDRVQVRLNSTGRTITLGRSVTHYRILNGVKYFKSTYPLCLAWAITAHRAQVRLLYS